MIKLQGWKHIRISTVIILSGVQCDKSILYSEVIDNLIYVSLII